MVDGIQPPSTVHPNRRETVLAQHFQMLGYGRLRDPELLLDHGDDTPGRQLAVHEQLEDPASDRICENLERVHDRQYISKRLYKPMPIRCLLESLVDRGLQGLGVTV